MPFAVILVEDNLVIRHALTSALSEIDGVHVIATADTADQATAALVAHADTWRLTVVDILLSAGNGMQVLRAGRNRRGHQHMIVLSNYATPDIRRKALEYGADAVFDKSMELEQFLDLCRHHASGRGSEVAVGQSAPSHRDTAKGAEEVTKLKVVDRG
jgi:DNA-binding NarL/FixJ family response regulator